MAHASLSSPFGMLTVFVEDAAVVALDWGRAATAAPGAGLEQAVAELQAYLGGAPMTFTVPVNPAGGAFHRRVWQHLCEIPWGTTLTYGELARALGTAPRAVAGACARNPIPIIIPCHRVVGAGGALCGYSGGDGIATKAALLALEGIVTKPAEAHRGVHSRRRRQEGTA
ncbi:MAG: methylated-DNA--[protein]-cysteine S-methyltransferase [Rhodospirillales bacterium]|nr:methylated-DNA--[protein]-cysteine S-methyltransferase [Rhodospirillales bacterium]